MEAPHRSEPRLVTTAPRGAVRAEAHRSTVGRIEVGRSGGVGRTRPGRTLRSGGETAGRERRGLPPSFARRPRLLPLERRQEVWVVPGVDEKGRRNICRRSDGIGPTCRDGRSSSHGPVRADRSVGEVRTGQVFAQDAATCVRRRGAPARLVQPCTVNGISGAESILTAAGPEARPAGLRAADRDPLLLPRPPAPSRDLGWISTGSASGSGGGSGRRPAPHRDPDPSGPGGRPPLVRREPVRGPEDAAEVRRVDEPPARSHGGRRQVGAGRVAQVAPARLEPLVLDGARAR